MATGKILGVLIVLIACAVGVAPSAADAALGPVARSKPPEAPTETPGWGGARDAPPSRGDANDYYYFRGERIGLLRSRTECAARLNRGVDRERTQETLRSLLAGDFSEFVGPLSEGLILIRFRDDILPAESEAAIDAIRAEPGVEFVFPVFIGAETQQRLLLTDEVIVKPRPGVTIADITGLEPSYGLVVVDNMPGTDDEYLLRIQDPKTVDALTVANTLWESGLVQWAEPQFIQEYQRFLTPTGSRGSAILSRLASRPNRMTRNSRLMRSG